MRIAVISTYTHPTRLAVKELSIMQSSVPELIAALCPAHAEIELYNEKEQEIPLDRHWDLVFFTYLHSYYEHTKILSALFRQRGMTTVAGGRHASHNVKDCGKYFDSVVVTEPEANIPQLVADFEKGRLQKVYKNPSLGPEQFSPYRYDLIDFKTNPYRMPGIEASRGCPFRCSFCVLTGHETYRYRPVQAVIDEIQFKLVWNKNYLNVFDNTFIFLDNNLGGSPKYLKELCEALIPLKKAWGCAVTFNILENPELIKLMAKAGCRYIYTGIESLNPDAIASFNKKQNRIKVLKETLDRVFSEGILVSFGLIVGADDDTNEYLTRVPEYLNDLGAHSVTYLGFVCPYPETPFFAQLKGRGSLLPNVSSRDLDGYTLCQRPERIGVDELVEHYKRLSLELTSWKNVSKHYWHRLFASSRRRYKTAILVSAREILSVRNPTSNPERTYIAGFDPIEAWDEEMRTKLGIPLQYVTSAAVDVDQPDSDSVEQDDTCEEVPLKIAGANG